MKRFIPFIFAFILLVSLIPLSVSAVVFVPDVDFTNPDSNYCVSECSYNLPYHSIDDYKSEGYSFDYFIFLQTYYQSCSNSNVFCSRSTYFNFSGDISNLNVEESNGIFHISSNVTHFYEEFTTYSNTIHSDGSISSRITDSFNGADYGIQEFVYNSNTKKFYYKTARGFWGEILGTIHSLTTNIFYSSDISNTTTSPNSDPIISEVTTISPDDFNNQQLETSNSILDNVKSLLSSIINLPSKIAESIQGFFITLGNTIIEKLEYLFIPSGDNLFSDVKDIISEKFGIFNQLFDLASILIHYDFSEEPPDFNITLYGHTITIVDWDLFAKYRPFIHGIIIFIAYYFFIQRLIKRIPQIIRGI